jgi:2-iminobutanoate/2-iminopropanoate deaminase
MSSERTIIESPHPGLTSTRADQVPRSAGVRVGNLLFVSGQLSIDPGTGNYKAGSVTLETQTALTNLSDLLRAAGTELANAVKVTINLSNILDYDEMNTVYRSFFTGDSLPARTVCAVTLPYGSKVEIECIAAIP